MGPVRFKPNISSPGWTPLSVIAAEQTETENWRYIQGGIDRLPRYASVVSRILRVSLNLLPEGNNRGELLGLFSPGFRKPTFSRAYFSAINRDELEMNCSMHGGERACIACGYCALVCPVASCPSSAYKAILAGEVEELLEHGLLDCVECALCSYVCPSKIKH